MDVITKLNSYSKLKKRPLVLTLGTFDGVHRGHQHILKEVCLHAKNKRGVSAIFTFSEHPIHVLRHKEPPYLITSTPHRLRLLDQLGFNLCFLIKFDKNFSRQSPEKFVRNILIKRLGVKEVILGYDSRFGKNREGTSRTMRDLSRKYGFNFKATGSRLFRGEPISSTKIRSLIHKGKLSSVEQCLGRPYSILGDVVQGSGLGKKLGFPTANLNPHCEALPPRGVYLVSIEIVNIGLKKTRNSNRYHLEDRVVKKGLWGLVNIGFRPTVERELGRKTKKLTAELHILNFKGNLYGKTLEVTFKKRIRNEIQFKSLEILKNQIKKDVKSADNLIKSSVKSRS